MENRLVRETDWSRRYSSGPNQISYESKFLVDNLEVKAEEIIGRWAHLSDSERLDFAFAFQCKPEISAEDERILAFLMEVGNETIWSTISLMLCRLSNRKLVSDFLLARIESAKGNRENYYRAVEITLDHSFVPVLEAQFHEYLKRIERTSDADSKRDVECREFLQLCQTLATITENDKYANLIETFLNDPSPLVRRKAGLLLERRGR